MKIAAVVGAISIFLLPAIAEACSRTVSQKATKTLVPAERIDQALLENAIRDEVNFHRCRAGLRSVGDAGKALSKQAETHSLWMAKTGTLSHKSTLRGAATLQQRVKNAKLKVRTGSENIGAVHRYQIDGQRFRILNSNTCEFATHAGQPLPAHSYASLARHIVSLWMGSRGHRKNILDKRVTAMSAAVAFDPSAQYCGKFWVTQNFVG